MRILLALPLLALGACATGGNLAVVSAGPAGITYRIAQDRLPQATSAAQDYCRERGRTARLDRVTPTGARESTASFLCE